MNLTDTHYRPKEVAKMLSLSPDTLKQWRSRQYKNGPPWVKIGGRVWYKKTDIEDFINQPERK